MSDINKKLASLTPEQSKQLASGLNSAYAQDRKKSAPAKKKKPTTKGKK